MIYSVCSSAQLDLYLDGELSPEETKAFAAHLATCPECAALAAQRTALRQRLQIAAKAFPAPAGLDYRIRQQLAPAPHHYSWAWGVAAAAAMLLVAAVVSTTWKNGGLRFTEGSQSQFIADIEPGVSPVMQIGLRQHVHCAVFRKHPTPWPSIAEMVNDIGAQYAEVVPAMQRHLPEDFRIAEAHLCTYRDRHYVHLTATDGTRLVSLLITDRVKGEAFENDLRPVYEAAGDPLFMSSARRFNIAGFETRSHFVYLVSDLGADGNMQELRAMTPELDHAIRQIEL